MMSGPGFTATSAIYRGPRSYAGRGGGSAPPGVVPASPCGYFCDCDPGQCCEVTAGGLNCACKPCGTHLDRVRMPQFLTR